MKKLILLLLSLQVHAQTFDFTCHTLAIDSLSFSIIDQYETEQKFGSTEIDTISSYKSVYSYVHYTYTGDDPLHIQLMYQYPNTDQVFTHQSSHYVTLFNPYRFGLAATRENGYWVLEAQLWDGDKLLSNKVKDSILIEQ